MRAKNEEHLDLKGKVLLSDWHIQPRFEYVCSVIFKQ